MDYCVDEASDAESLVSDDSFRFLPAQVGDTEELELYQRGGFHPVHLGGLYDGRHYRIVHKIGAGGFSTVWLARDEIAFAWVALKIVVADKSAEVEEKAIVCHNIASKLAGNVFVTYKRYFHIEGPNGRHLCLGSSPTGTEDRFKFAEALAELHSHGLCHGAMLFSRICNLDHLDDEGIYDLFGKPEIGHLKTCSGEMFGTEAPRYIVGYLKFMAADVDILQEEICLIDFDQTFLASEPPKKLLGTPPGYLSPEVALGRPAGPASDVWALGCTLLHIRPGSSPFAVFDIDCAENLIRLLMEYMGDLPTSWGEPLFDDHGSPTLDEARDEPMTDLSNEKRLLKQWIQGIWDQPSNLDEL